MLLKLQPYVHDSVVSHPYPKLAMKYFGPYKVLERIGVATYKMDLLADSLVHPVFHISQLKPLTPSYVSFFHELPKPVDLTSQPLELEEILERRLVKER